MSPWRPPTSSLIYLVCSSRKSLLRARIMDFITSTATVPLLLGCVGVFSLCKLLQWLRTRADVRNAVVVITGATSGLGRGGWWGSAGRGAAVWVQTHEAGWHLGSKGGTALGPDRDRELKHSERWP